MRGTTVEQLYILEQLGLVWIEGNEGKRKEMIWRDGESLVWIAKMEGENLKGMDLEGLSPFILLTFKSLHKSKDLEGK